MGRQKCISHRQMIDCSTEGWPTRPYEANTNGIANIESRVRRVEIRPAREVGEAQTSRSPGFHWIWKVRAESVPCFSSEECGNLWSLTEEAQLPS